MTTQQVITNTSQPPTAHTDSNSNGKDLSGGNPFAALIQQDFAIIPEFEFESGETLHDVPVAYKTWGKLNAEANNCLVLCHALTGSADVEDWWGPLLGPDRAFDPTRYFIFCANVIGSPYGTISSVTTNPATGKPYGPEMPGSSVKDDVRLHYQVLLQLGVKSVAAVIGGSMGGMTCLEWPLNTPPGFVSAIVPLATSARHSAWCISWGEAQRQSIYSDPNYDDGYYYLKEDGSVDLFHQPTRGLAAARMAALLTYRSRDSFESRFGRKKGGGRKSKVPSGGVRVMGGSETTDPLEPSEAELIRSPAWVEHNDGHRPNPFSKKTSPKGSPAPTSPVSSEDSLRQQQQQQANGTPNGHGAPLTNLNLGVPNGTRPPKLGTGGTPHEVFNAQSYLRYQGDKFTGRFDANCYIHITRKLDTHDLSNPSRFPGTISSTLPISTADDDVELEAALHYALSKLPPALVIGIESDGLFQPSEQRELARYIPDAELVLIPSPDGHDGFLLEFQAINGWIEGWLRRKMPQFYGERVVGLEEYEKGENDGFGVKKESVFGEAEADVTRW